MKRANVAQAEELFELRKQLESGKMSKKNGAVVKELETRLQELKYQHETLRDEMARRLEEKERVASKTREDRHLVQEQCKTHIKERQAILTIMEQKIKTLVENATLAAETFLKVPQGQRLRKELSALKRLVNASVTALKNSASDSPSSSSAIFSKSTPLPGGRKSRAVFTQRQHSSTSLKRRIRSSDSSSSARVVPATDRVRSSRRFVGSGSSSSGNNGARYYRDQKENHL